MTEVTLREAAIFSLAMSKAWNAGIGSGSAYWVTPEQVSKTPQSGEFLPRGAWVVRGKRNYYEKLELRLSMGIARIGAEEKVMCGPVDAVKVNCRDPIEIIPGEMNKELAAKELAVRFSTDLATIQSILPPGNLTIIG
jgi:hypothetical protein